MKYTTNHISIRERPSIERPRERIISAGAQSLSDMDLISTLIGSGTRGTSVDRLAEKIQQMLDSSGSEVSAAELMNIIGLGPAKASVITAALELGRRRFPTVRSRITHPGDAYPLIRHYADRMQEHFIRISLNGAHEVLSIGVVSIGLVNRTIVHPREVFADPIRERATAVLVAHNHPSGNLLPSREDRDITARLKEAGGILGIGLLDHLIFSQDGFYSFLEHDIL
jgi:DNA repair protein RadC